MIRTGSLFSQILSLFQRPDFARHVRTLKAEYHARGFPVGNSSWRCCFVSWTKPDHCGRSLTD
jgi:hypothetical protein